MGLGSEGVQGQAGVALPVVFGQQVWICFAGSSNLEHELPDTVFPAIYYLWTFFEILLHT